MDGLTTPPLTLEEAQARLINLATPLAIEHAPVEAAIGRYLAEPVRARRTQPGYDLSSMDGYAVRSNDLAGPWRVVGESAAGHPYTGHIAPGEAVRISTGAILPGDAAAVILQEDTAQTGNDLLLTGEVPQPASQYIRSRGADFALDTQVMPAGIAVGAPQIALAIAAGHTHLSVRRPPRIAIIDSGDELAADPTNCTPHQIPASNGAMLFAMIGSVPAEATRIGPVPDDLDAIATALEAAADADLIVTSGGASVGDHDLIRPALERWGAKITFWRVAIKPGKPLLVATREVAGRKQIILGLPGNPVSSYVTGYLFLLPFLRAMLGASSPLPLSISTRLAVPLRKGGQRREFLRARWDGRTVTPQTLQDSGALSPLADANVLIDRAAFAEAMQAGEEVSIFLLGNGCIG